MLKKFSPAFVPKGGSYTLWWAAEDDGPYSANVWYIEGSKMFVEAKPKYETAYYVRCVED